MLHFKYVLLIFLLIGLYSCGNDSNEGDAAKKEAQQTVEFSASKELLFRRLSSEESGFYFINELQENANVNILQYEYLYNGSGVAIGDINADGLPDIFMGGNLFGGRLFLNLGDMKFKQISEEAGVFQTGYTTGVCMVDVNQDGYDDIYLCRSLFANPEDRRNVLLINNGDLTFTDKAAEYNLDDPSFSTHANFFDYDNDGDLDMYLLNHRVDFKDALTLKVLKNSAGEEVNFVDTNFQYVTDKLYENNGSGQFIDVTEKSGLINRCFGLSVSVADINKDGWQDLYIANDYADKDQLMINNGDGTFTDKIDQYFFHLSKNSMGCDIADFNNDAELDIINLDMMSEDNYRQKQLKGASPYDLYHMAHDYGLGHQVMRNTLHLNDGNGTFSEIGQLAGVSNTDWSWTPIFADFDNDGKKDLFISNGYYRDVTDMDYMRYESADIVQKAGGVSQVNQMDLVETMKSNPQPNYIYKNNGDLTFSNKSFDWGLSEKAFSNGGVVSDLDGDGDLDLILNNLGDESFIYENQTNKIHGNHFIDFKPSELGCKIWLFIDGDVQYQDFSPYRGYMSSHERLVHFGIGENTAVDSVLIQWRNGTTKKISSPQVDISHKLTQSDGEKCSPPGEQREEVSINLKQLAASSNATKGHNDFKYEPLLSRKNSNRGPFMAKGDVNNDGLMDFYVGGDAVMAGRLFIQSSNGLFVAKSVAAFDADKEHSDARSVFFDANGDGNLDLYVVSGGYQFTAGSDSYQDRLYINDGNGGFTKGKLPNITENGHSVATMDIDGDMDMDVLIFGGSKPSSYPYHEPSFVLVNEGGEFKRENNSLPNDGDLGIVTDAQPIQLDGKNYLVLTREWGSMMMLEAADGKMIDVTEAFGLSNTEGLWNCLYVEDIDGDGNDDFIAGNHGENDFYSVAAGTPGAIIAGDIDKNGSVDAIPFYYFSDGKSHPKHALDELFEQIPSLRKLFPTYHDYSISTKDNLMTEFAGKNYIEKKSRIQESSQFIYKDGKFERSPLPVAAQFSEVHGIVASDFNSDGHVDLFLAGNNYGVDANLGQMDAGGVQVILGRALQAKKGGFDTEYYSVDHGEYRSVIEVDGQIVLVDRKGGVYLVLID